MTRFIFNPLIAILVFINWGCENEPQPTIQGNDPEYGYLECTIQGKSYKDTCNSEVDNIKNEINVSSSQQYSRVLLKTYSSHKGIYFSNNSVQECELKYLDLAGNWYSSSNPGSSAVINIENIDTLKWKISGSFYGSIKDGNGNTLQLANGKFADISYLEPRQGSTISNQMEALIGARSFTGWTGISCQNGIITLHGNSGDSTLSLQMPLMNPGSYPMSPSKDITTSERAVQGSFRYFNRTTYSYFNYHLTSGQLTISSHDFWLNKISGTFQYNVQDDSGKEVSISNGSFSVQY